jgi:hypothetical protein
MNRILAWASAVLIARARRLERRAAGADSDLARFNPGSTITPSPTSSSFASPTWNWICASISNKVLFGAVASKSSASIRAPPNSCSTRAISMSGREEKPSNVWARTAKSETTWVSRPFHFDKKDPILGSALVIELPPSKKADESSRSTTSDLADRAGLQWLTAKQTAGKHQPFMYTPVRAHRRAQLDPAAGYAAGARDLQAHIHTDLDVLAVMSAQNDPKAKRNGEYSFIMPEAVPRT